MVHSRRARPLCDTAAGLSRRPAGQTRPAVATRKTRSVYRMQTSTASHRVAILSFLHNVNYGSILQAYALQQVLRGMGCDPCHLNYQPDMMEKTLNLLANRNSPALLVQGAKKRKLVRREPAAGRKKAEIARFTAANLCLTAPLRNRHALAHATSAFDTVLCGSDQIWSPTWLNTAYYLDFVKAGQRRVAYAPSLGVQREPPARKRAAIRRALTGFRWVSVREESGRQVLQRITRREDIAVVLDPVCLLPAEHWLRLAAHTPRQRPYVLCYLLDNHAGCYRTVEFIAECMQLDILVVPVTRESYRLPYTVLGGLTPQEWLGYIAGARYVITDSFHCVAFSVLFQRDFLFVRRDADANPRSRNSRILDFLQLLGVQHAAQGGWAAVTANLERQRKRSLDWLRSALTER